MEKVGFLLLFLIISENEDPNFLLSVVPYFSRQASKLAVASCRSSSKEKFLIHGSIVRPHLALALYAKTAFRRTMAQ